MAGFFIWLLIGLLAGAILVPIGFYIMLKMRDAMQRRKIKRDIAAGKFLMPLDERDYDAKAWVEIITPAQQEANKQELASLDDKLFHKGQFKDAEEIKIPEVITDGKTN